MADQIIGPIVGVIVAIIVGVLIYFVPSFTARGKRHSDAIFILNLTLGWTVLGWIGALIWAMVTPTPSTIAPVPTRTLSDAEILELRTQLQMKQQALQSATKQGI